VSICEIAVESEKQNMQIASAIFLPIPWNEIKWNEIWIFVMWIDSITKIVSTCFRWFQSLLCFQHWNLEWRRVINLGNRLTNYSQCCIAERLPFRKIGCYAVKEIVCGWIWRGGARWEILLLPNANGRPINDSILSESLNGRKCVIHRRDYFFHHHHYHRYQPPSPSRNSQMQSCIV